MNIPPFFLIVIVAAQRARKDDPCRSLRCDEKAGEYCEIYDENTGNQIAPFCQKDPCFSFNVLNCKADEYCEISKNGKPVCKKDPCSHLNCKWDAGEVCENIDHQTGQEVAPYCFKDPCANLQCKWETGEVCEDVDHKTGKPVTAFCFKEPCADKECNWEAGEVCFSLDKNGNNVPPYCEKEV